jgi:hypothetical protein
MGPGPIECAAEPQNDFLICLPGSLNETAYDRYSKSAVALVPRPSMLSYAPSTKRKHWHCLSFGSMFDDRIVIDCPVATTSTNGSMIHARLSSLLYFDVEA